MQLVYSGADIVFMTRGPAEHHQLVIAAGHPADLAFSTINQISFRLDSLQSMRELIDEWKAEIARKITAASAQP